MKGAAAGITQLCRDSITVHVFPASGTKETLFKHFALVIGY